MLSLRGFPENKKALSNNKIMLHEIKESLPVMLQKIQEAKDYFSTIEQLSLQGKIDITSINTGFIFTLYDCLSFIDNKGIDGSQYNQAFKGATNLVNVFTMPRMNSHIRENTDATKDYLSTNRWKQAGKLCDYVLEYLEKEYCTDSRVYDLQKDYSAKIKQVFDTTITKLLNSPQPYLNHRQLESVQMQ